MVESGEAVDIDGIEYLCFGTADVDEKHYLYLITTNEPNEVFFGEQVIKGDDLQIRIIGNRAEKQKLIKLMQEKNKRIRILNSFPASVRLNNPRSRLRF